jgi:hypothetical protein
VLKSCVPDGVEKDVDDHSLRRRDKHFVHKRLAFVPTTVTTDELCARATNGEVENPRVRRIDKKQADDFSTPRLAGELELTIDKQDVPETPHRGERRHRPKEGRDLAVFDKEIVQRDGHLPVGRRPVRRVGRLYDNGAVQSQLLRIIFTEVRVVPIATWIRKVELYTRNMYAASIFRYLVAPR